MTKRDEIVIVMNNLSTKKTNTITTNVTNTASINCHSKKVRDWYILHTILLAIIFLFLKTDGIIKIYDGTRYLTLFDSEKYEAIYNNVRCLISEKQGITYIFLSLFRENQNRFF